jgi:hypothetical protein
VTGIAAARPVSAEGAIARSATWLRLSFALQRWELLLVGAGTVLLGAVMLWIAWQVTSIVDSDPACFAAGGGGGVACQVLQERFNTLGGFGRQLLYFSFGAPFGIGLILGIPIVAREVDHSTASLAWTMSRSRVRWLLPRVAFVALVVIGLLGILAVVSDVLAQTILPQLNLAADFTWYGRRGGLLVTRGLLALGIGLTVGAILGRQLPALLVAIFATVLLFTAVSLGMDRWNETDAIEQPYGVQPSPGALHLQERLKLDDGTVLGWQEMTERYSTISIGQDGTLYTEFDDQGLNPSNPVGRVVSLTLPGELYPTVVLRESALLAMLALLAAGLAFVVVTRRRPY